MTDGRYRMTVMAVCLTVAASVLIWRLPQICNALKGRGDKPKSETVKEREYVHIGPGDVVHTDRKCSKLNYKGYSSQRIRVNELARYSRISERGVSFCPYCVADSDYEVLKKGVVERGVSHIKLISIYD